MKQFGEYAGMAFQIKDDLFDYHKTNLIGKPTGNDLREKKLTLPLIYALNHCKNGEKSHILDIVRNRKKTSDDLREVSRFVESNGGFLYAGEVMQSYSDKAIDMLSAYPESPIKAAMVQYVRYITSREN
jgi:octaprenyl-diphosphate synthase